MSEILDENLAEQRYAPQCKKSADRDVRKIMSTRNNARNGNANYVSAATRLQYYFQPPFVCPIEQVGQ